MAMSLADWYITIQNTRTTKDVSRNTKEAKHLGLIKTRFGIKQEKPNDPSHLFVRVWDASKDWGGDYRIVFDSDASDMQGRAKMVELLVEAILHSKSDSKTAIS